MVFLDFIDIDTMQRSYHMRLEPKIQYFQNSAKSSIETDDFYDNIQ